MSTKNVISKNGVWKTAPMNGNRFIVTLTPTAQDFSGTMDKTVAEINAAYEAGQEIVFEIHAQISGANTILSSVASETIAMDSGGSVYGMRGFHATFIVESMDLMIRATTIAGDTGTLTTYSTYIYELTPAT